MLALVLLLLITPMTTTIVFARHHGGGSGNNGSGGDDYTKGLDTGTSAAQSDNPNFDNTKSVSDCMNQGTTYTVAYCQGFVKGYYDTENSLIPDSGSPSSPSPPNEQSPQQTGPSNINPGGGNGGSLVTKLCNSINSHPTLALALGHLLGFGVIGPAAAQAYCATRSR